MKDTRAGTTAQFAERVLEIVASGRRTATYKLAVLLGILDLCALHSDDQGRAPSVIYTRDLAEEVARLYWPQVAAFPLDGGDMITLRQISMPRSTVIDAVRQFRDEAVEVGATSFLLSKSRLPAQFELMLDRVEVTIAEEPLPRLQMVGTSGLAFPFIYELDWGPRESFSRRRLRALGPRGAEIRLCPGAGDELIRLAPLIRPLVEGHWVRMVSQRSNVAPQEQRLRDHMFGSERTLPPLSLREWMLDLQGGGCFLCLQEITGPAHADHFIARVRSGVDAIENLVMAHAACNGDKKDLLPHPRLVDRWADRNHHHRRELAELAASVAWESDLPRTIAVAKSIYSHLPGGDLPFWAGRSRIEMADPGRAVRALASR